MSQRLKKLQLDLQRWNQDASDCPVGHLAKAMSFPLHGGIHLSYWGPCSEYSGEPFDMFLDALTDPQLAEQIVSLEIDGPDEGANGSQLWCFSRWLSEPATFSRLKHFSVRLTEAADHNISAIVAKDAGMLDENGEIGRLLQYMPGIESLRLPSTPSENFFNLELPKLTHLRVQSSGFPRGFIARMAQSELRLKQLDFTDSNEAFDLSSSAGSECGPATMTEYAALMKSAAMGSAHSLVLRNARLLEGEYLALQALNPKCSIQIVVEPPASYVTHWRPKCFPFRHLLWVDHISNQESA